MQVLQRVDEHCDWLSALLLVLLLVLPPLFCCTSSCSNGCIHTAVQCLQYIRACKHVHSCESGWADKLCRFMLPT